MKLRPSIIIDVTENIKALQMGEIPQQPTWITNTPTSSQSSRDLLFPTLTSLPSSTHTHIRHTSLLSSNKANRSILPTSTKPNTPISAKKAPALVTTEQCPSTPPTNQLPHLIACPPLVRMTTSLALLQSKNTSPLSPKLLLPLHPTPSSIPKMHPYPFTSQLPTKRPTWNTPRSPHKQQKCYSACTPTSMTPSMPSPSDLSPPYTDAPWLLARKLKKDKCKKHSCGPNS